MIHSAAVIARRAAVATVVLFGFAVGCGPADDSGENSPEIAGTVSEPLVANGGFCFSGTQCQSGVCISFSCRAPLCNDGVKNGTETAVDCGGSVCPPCPGTCNDAIKNGSETGVDCGGSVCPPCPGTCNDAIKNGSETGVDCGGSVCPPCPGTCTDGVKNGSETDVDCGGSSCLKCARGRACLAATDCASNGCFFGRCF